MSFKLPDIRLSRGLIIASLVCFLLSFVTVSCGAQEVSLTGVQLVTGTTVLGQEVGSVPEAVLALLLAIIALGVSFLGNKFLGLASAIASGMGSICLLLLKSKFDTATAQSGAFTKVTVDPGFWLSLLSLLAATALNGWLAYQQLTVSQQHNNLTAPISELSDEGSDTIHLADIPDKIE